jgi:hypothetical protein
MATKSGNLDVKETGEAEFLLPWRPSFVEAEFVDGLADVNDANCADIPPDQLVVHVRSDRNTHYVCVRWRIGKPRKIFWTASS